MKRPSLADHVLARRHRVGLRNLVVLHDGNRAACIGDREWAVLRAADGTRDCEGIALAAGPVRRDHLDDFLGQLEGAGMLREGAAEAPAATPRTDRPVAALAGFVLSCDGRGTCCRLYPTTVFSPLEVARAQSLAPDVLDCGLSPEAAFTPERGSTMPPWRARAVAMVDGHCAFLADDACVLHRAGGPRDKPAGCRLYPATFVDDGAEVRMSVAPECRCVFTSARSASEAAAIDLEAAAHIDELPLELPLSHDRHVDRQWAIAFDDALVAALSLERDAIDVLLGLDAALSDDRAPSLDVELAALARRLDAYAETSAWRAPADFARAVPMWMRAAIEQPESSVDRQAETFYLRAVAFGHLWWRQGEPPLREGLRRRAARLFCARRLRAAIAPDHPLAAHPALDEPIALVEATCRAFAL